MHTHNDTESYLYHLHIALIQVRFGVFVCRWAWPGKRLCHGACQRHSHALYVSFAIDIFDYLSLKVDKSPRAKPAKGFCLSFYTSLSLSLSLRSISISPIDDDRSICAMTWKLSLVFLFSERHPIMSHRSSAPAKDDTVLFSERKDLLCFRLLLKVEGKTWINSLVEQLISFRAPHSLCLWYKV